MSSCQLLIAKYVHIVLPLNVVFSTNQICRYSEYYFSRNFVRYMISSVLFKFIYFRNYYFWQISCFAKLFKWIICFVLTYRSLSEILNIFLYRGIRNASFFLIRWEVIMTKSLYREISQIPHIIVFLHFYAFTSHILEWL